MILAAVTLLSLAALWTGIAASPSARQAAFDREGARLARGLAKGSSAPGGEDVPSERLASRSDAAGWRQITDEQMRRRCGGCAPRGYRFSRRATVDLDHDGKMDFVDLVTTGREDAVRISYGGAHRPARIVMRSAARHWSDQGLFGIGRESVLLNQPEANALHIFQQGANLRVQYIGD